MKILPKIQSIIHHIFTRIIVVFEFILLLRAVLLYFQANPETFVVSRVYAATDELVRPFWNIFPNISWLIGTIDMTTIASMVGYALFFFLLYVGIIFIFTILEKLIARD